MEFVDEPEAICSVVAVNMFRAWYMPFYGHGVIHGDPYLGNYSVRPDYSVNLMDFGCRRIFKPKFVSGIINLYRAFRDGDEALAVHGYESLGFEGLDREVIDILNLWARFVYAPLMEDRIQPIQETGGSHYGAEVTPKVRREQHRVGDVTSPREVVLIDRTAIGLDSVSIHLKVRTAVP